jgi:hypothetical protein
VSSDGNHRPRRRFLVCETRESPRGPSRGCTADGMGSRNGSGGRMSPSTARAWKISSDVIVSAWTGLGSMWKYKGLMSKGILILSLSSLTPIHAIYIYMYMYILNLTSRLPLVVYTPAPRSPELVALSSPLTLTVVAIWFCLGYYIVSLDDSSFCEKVSGVLFGF